MRDACNIAASYHLADPPMYLCEFNDLLNDLNAYPMPLFFG
jgi:hypothetical protein